MHGVTYLCVYVLCIIDYRLKEASLTNEHKYVHLVAALTAAAPVADYAVHTSYLCTADWRQRSQTDMVFHCQQLHTDAHIWMMHCFSVSMCQSHIPVYI